MDATDRLRDEIRTAREHLARADTKASILLGLSGAGAATGAGLITARQMPGVAEFVAWTAVVAAVAAAALLALAVRPTLHRAGSGWGIVRHADTSPADMVTQLDDASVAATELASTSVLAVTKYRRIQRAVDLLLTALALAVLAAVLTVLL